MNLIEHTIAWYKGEIFEGAVFGGFGLFIITISALLWIYGKTPRAGSLIIPLIFVGFILISASISNMVSNSKQIEKIEEKNVKADENFIRREIHRVESFQNIYTYTKIGAGIVFFISLLIFFLTENRHLLSIAVALILLGVSGLVIDYFSKERADIYYKHLTHEIENR